jgi:hypothetical protein
MQKEDSVLLMSTSVNSRYGLIVEEAESSSVDHGGVERGAGVDDTILRLELTETDLQKKIFLEI